MMSRLPAGFHHPMGPPSWSLLLPLLLATIVAAACSVRPSPGPDDGEPGSPGSPSRPGEALSPAAGETPIRITITDTVTTARLADNATAHDLAAQLPLTLTFTDFNQVEKIAKLRQPLSLDGVPAGADPDIGDIGYYAPSGDVVFYYGDVGYFDGIVRIGRFDTSTDHIEHQMNNFQAHIELA